MARGFSYTGLFESNATELCASQLENASFAEALWKRGVAAAELMRMHLPESWQTYGNAGCQRMSLADGRYLMRWTERFVPPVFQ